MGTTKIGIDFGTIPNNELPPGLYDATIESVQWRESKNNEFGNLNWTFSIATPGFEKRKAWLTTALVPNGLWKLRDTMVVLGFPKDAMVDIEIDDVTDLMVSPDLTGRPVEIKVVESEYQGKKSFPVESITQDYYQGGAPGGVIPDLDADAPFATGADAGLNPDGSEPGGSGDSEPVQEVAGLNLGADATPATTTTTATGKPPRTKKVD